MLNQVQHDTLFQTVPQTQIQHDTLSCNSANKLHAKIQFIIFDSKFLIEFIPFLQSECISAQEERFCMPGGKCVRLR